MKRSYDFHEKISLKSAKKLHIPCELRNSTSIQLRNARRNEGAIATIPHTSRDPQQSVELEKGIQELTTPVKAPLEHFSTVATDSFRTRVTTKLRIALDGFVSELQSITQNKGTNTASFFNKVVDDNYLQKSFSGNNDEKNTAKLALQNFICSAKSQISRLLSKKQKVNVISDENCLLNTKSFNVDPLQIQISLKLQDLLCNALDNRRFDNNAINSNNPISETELQDLSHLLQDFLSSAKKKLSSSLNKDSGNKTSSTSRSGTCTAESPSSENQLSKSPINNKSLQKKALDKQLIQERNENEKGINKKRIQQRSNTRISKLESDQVSENLFSQSLIGNKSFQDIGSHKQQIRENNTNKQVPNIRRIQESSTCVNPNSGHINKNKLIQPLNRYRSCQNKGSNKCHNSEKVLGKQPIQEGSRSISTESISDQNDKNNLFQQLNQIKSCQTKELRRFNPTPKPNSKIIKIKQPQSINLHPKTMESYDKNKSSSREGRNGLTYMNGGILLLSECERTPDFLDLTLEVHDSDVDDPVYDASEFIHSGYGDQDSDSDEDVVVLGEKRPTYQEITLDEDDDGEVYEQVIELEKPTKLPKDLEALLYDCPKCEKKFRVESLLKFHVRMHSVVESHGRVASPSSFDPTVPETTSDEDCVNNRDRTPQKSKPSKRHPRKEKENSNSKSSHKHKIHREKHVRKKSKISS